MAKFKFDVGEWLDDDIRGFAYANGGTIQVAKSATWEGAKIIADEIHAEASKHGNLANGLRIARHQVDSDSVNTLIWFDGYDTDGVAYAQKANAINSGRSTPNGGKTKADRFVSRAERKAAAKAKKAMQMKFAEEIKKLLDKR